MGAGPQDGFPRIERLGLSDLLVRFGDRFDPAANAAAVAFRTAVEDLRGEVAGVVETASTLAGVHLALDPHAADVDGVAAWLGRLLARQDWSAAGPPAGRRRWDLPVRLGGPDMALEDAAAAAGLRVGDLIAVLEGAELSVLTIGFAPGQPYLGPLPALADLPRRATLVPQVAPGTLAVALGQMVLFTTPSPTGWHPVGWTGFPAYRPDAPDPCSLRPGDLVVLVPEVAG